MLVQADQIKYDYPNNSVAAIGNVQIYYRGASIEADQVTYDQKAKRLLAQGNATQSITFTSAAGVPAAGDWAGLIFAGDAVGATYSGGAYISGSIVQYAAFAYAGGSGAPLSVPLKTILPPLWLVCGAIFKLRLAGTLSCNEAVTLGAGAAGCAAAAFGSPRASR